MDFTYEEFRQAWAVAMADDDLEKTREENQQLCDRYPFLIPMWDYDEDWNSTPAADYNYEWTHLDDLHRGWKHSFGVQMCEELRDILIEGDYLDKYRVAQAKEKWGFLHWYDNGIPKSVSDKYHAWLKKYEDLSEQTCIVCGKHPVKLVTRGWISPYCEECFHKQYGEDKDYNEWTKQHE